jgi:NAD(P)-dependent dehydrogenase (short-subunit alcohol dehydrogenase family)
MKKNILLFGANSFIAKTFIRDYSDQYSIHPVYRQGSEQALSLDFDDADAVNAFANRIDFSIDGILFLQGINPSMGARDITEKHFVKMLKVNLVTPVLLISALADKLSVNCLVLFISSVAKRKGSYDPSYAAAKSGLSGLMYSLANSYSKQRFNMISLGLVAGSPVYQGMTEDFRAKHAARMQNGEFILPENVTGVMDMLIRNNNINTTDIAIDGGYK